MEMNSKNSNVGGLLLLLVIVGILIVTNPTKTDFIEFTDNELVKMESYTTVSNNSISSLINGLSRKIISENIKANSYRDSYLLFSVFTIKNNGKDYKFIGGLKMIYPKLSTININKFSY